MKTSRIVLFSVLGVFVLLLALLAPIVRLFTAGLRPPVSVPDPAYWPTDGWQQRTPEEMGIESKRLASTLMKLQKNGSSIDSLLIIHDGYVILDAYFAPYDGSFPHDLASVTKSVMTTLVAIAAGQGSLDLDRPMVSYFPDRTIANLDEHKQHITVRHLVESRNGMQSGCFEKDGLTLDEMRSHPDWIQAALDRPMTSEPGEEFCYDSPGFHILSAILQQVTGMTTHEFARQYLFAPLGIQNSIWDTDPQGYTRGWGDLHLLPEDAARIGYLWLHQGMWDGKQVVPQAWVLDSVRLHSRPAGSEFGYGYGWWISPPGYYAAGREGQNVRIFAKLNTVVVTTGGGFDFPEIESSLIPIFLSLKDFRPADPQDQAALADALKSISQEEIPSANPSADLVNMISGKRYLCDDNPVGVENASFDVSNPAQAVLSFRMNGQDRSWPIGLDGKYRFSPDGTAARGGWKDGHTFDFIVFDVGVLERLVTFESNTLSINLPEADITVTCLAQEP